MIEYPECLEYPEYQKERKIEDEVTDHKYKHIQTSNSHWHLRLSHHSHSHSMHPDPFG